MVGFCRLLILQSIPPMAEFPRSILPPPHDLVAVPYSSPNAAAGAAATAHRPAGVSHFHRQFRDLSQALHHSGVLAVPELGNHYGCGSSPWGAVMARLDLAGPTRA